tara:strand:+ start:2013 stop:2402 length:390 start_codon:yes stop_codon:yes gene_type:complete
MKRHIIIDDTWPDGLPVVSEQYLKIMPSGGTQQQAYVEAEPPAPIRTISTGAMQRRFTIDEEVFIASDAAATVIKSRLLNASYCDLDFQDTIDGVNYICGVLEAGAVIVDTAARSAELLVDGTEQERYI